MAASGSALRFHQITAGRRREAVPGHPPRPTAERPRRRLCQREATTTVAIEAWIWAGFAFAVIGVVQIIILLSLFRLRDDVDELRTAVYRMELNQDAAKGPRLRIVRDGQNDPPEGA